MEWIDINWMEGALAAGASVLSGILTYFIMRRRYEVNERAIYIGAVSDVTSSLREELRRVRRERDALCRKLEELEEELEKKKKPGASPAPAE